MGFDLIGRNPSSSTGSYFGCHFEGWPPLATYLIEVAPLICSRCKLWMSNDGDGLNALAARALADILQREIDSGRCAETAKIRKARLDALQAQTDPMPKLCCPACKGAGVRMVSTADAECPLFPIEAPVGSMSSCFLCRGVGSIRPEPYGSSFSVEQVKEFVGF